MTIFHRAAIAALALAGALVGAPAAAQAPAAVSDATAARNATGPAAAPAAAPATASTGTVALAPSVQKTDTGDTAWMLTSTALVLMMTIPGLALFYGGMVRRKNVIATVAQSFAITAIVTLCWCVVEYSLVFGTDADAGVNRFVGGFGRVFLDGISPVPDSRAYTVAGAANTIPEYVFMMYQMTFAIITPALVCGAFAERFRFSALCLFTVLWSLFVYGPVAHWVWGGGFLGGLGVLDFAGGTVVHVNAGVAGLVCALVLGPRVGFGRENMAPNNLVYTLIGASLLWVGWFGFNAGSAVGANALAGAAMAATQIAAAAAAVAWTAAEWTVSGKPTLLGMASGAVAGLVAITPASGFVLPSGALAIGLAAGAVCYLSAVFLKRALKYDDSLDAFGVHGVGGFVGALLTGVFASHLIQATDGVRAFEANRLHAVWIQLVGCLGTIAWSALGTFAILMVCKHTTGLRVSPDEELEGLDMALHGEALHEH